LNEELPSEPEDTSTRTSRGPGILGLIVAGAVGVGLTLVAVRALDAGRPIGVDSPTRPASAGGDPSSPLPPSDPGASRTLVQAALEKVGVPNAALEHGRLALRGPGRAPNETFPLLSFPCPEAVACGRTLDDLTGALAAGGLTLSRNIGGDRPNRPVFRAVSHAGQPVLALRAFPAGPRLVVVVKGLGADPGLADALLTLNEHVTFAIRPGSASADQLAARLADAGREVLVELPLEAEPPQRPEGTAVLGTSMTPEALVEATDALLARLPVAVGAIGHKGGRIEASAPHIGAVLKSIERRGLFFVEDRASPTSVAEATARVLGVRLTKRTHVLDAPSQEVSAAQKAVEAALVLEGAAVAVVQGDAANLQVLRTWLLDLERRRIRLYRASETAL
jgi:polysaccharide deacetylase 2 family uncharacterized protein YibQ